jgi:hypothetical protein
VPGITCLLGSRSSSSSSMSRRMRAVHYRCHDQPSINEEPHLLRLSSPNRTTYDAYVSAYILQDEGVDLDIIFLRGISINCMAAYWLLAIGRCRLSIGQWLY